MRCVVVHANAEAAGNPIKHHRANDRLPVPHEESTHGSEVECSQKSAQPPVDSLTFGLHHFTFLNVFQFNPPPAIQLPTRFRRWYQQARGVIWRGAVERNAFQNSLLCVRQKKGPCSVLQPPSANLQMPA